MKSSLLIISAVTGLSFSACSTTGGLAESLAKQTAMSSITSKATVSATPTITQAPIVDGTMDCAALSAELSKVNTTIKTSHAIISGSGQSNIAGQVAATGASQAALHSGAAGAIAKIPFGGLFAKKAMDSVSNSGQKKVEKAQAELQNANLRKASLTGLYAGKNCAS